MATNENGADGADTIEKELEGDVAIDHVDSIDPESATPEQVKDLIAKSKTLAAQKAHWKKSAVDPVTGKKYRDIAPKAPLVIPPPHNTEGDKKADERLSRLEQSEEKRTFGHAHGLSPEEVDNVFASAKGLGIDPKAALEKPFVKAGIAEIRRAVRVDGATPGPSSRSPVVEGKSFKDMKPEDRRANFGKVVQGLQKR